MGNTRMVLKFTAVGTAASIALLASLAHASFQQFTCTIADVAVFPDRIHVHCSNFATNGSANTINFFAISTTDAAVADRFLTLAATAVSGSRPVIIAYDTVYANHSFSNVSSCDQSNCRIPYQFALQ